METLLGIFLLFDFANFIFRKRAMILQRAVWLLSPAAKSANSARFPPPALRSITKFPAQLIHVIIYLLVISFSSGHFFNPTTRDQAEH